MKRGFLALILALFLFISVGGIFAVPQKSFAAPAVPSDPSAIPSQSTSDVLENLGSSDSLTGGDVGSLNSIGLGSIEAEIKEQEEKDCSGLLDSIGCKITDVVTDTMKGAILGTIGWSMSGVQAVSTKGDEILSSPNWGTKIDETAVIFRNIGLSLLTLAILIISLSNITGFKKDDYAIKRMVPKIFITMFLVFFSHAIAKVVLSLISGLGSLILDNFNGVVMWKAYSNLSDGMGQTISNGEGIAGAILLLAGGAVILLLFAIIFVLLPSIALMIILFLRVIMLYILLAIAPLAAMMNLLPLTEKYYKQWWAEFTKWAWMGFVIQLYLLLGAIFIESFLSGGTAVDIIISMVMVGIIFGLATKAALKSGGAVTAGVSGLANSGQKLLNTGVKAGQKRVGEEFMDRSGLGAMKANRARERSISRSALQRKSGDRWYGTEVGNFALGISGESGQRRYEESMISARAKALEEEGVDNARDVYAKSFESGDRREAEAAHRALLKLSSESAKGDDYIKGALRWEGESAHFKDFLLANASKVAASDKFLGKEADKAAEALRHLELLTSGTNRLLLKLATNKALNGDNGAKTLKETTQENAHALIKARDMDLSAEGVQKLIARGVKGDAIKDLLEIQQKAATQIESLIAEKASGHLPPATANHPEVQAVLNIVAPGQNHTQAAATNTQTPSETGHIGDSYEG